MANSLHTNPIILNTFTTTIDFSSEYSDLRIHSIEWVKPASTGDTFQILSGGAAGRPIFEEECTTAKENLIKYYPDVPFAPLYLAVASGVEKASGFIIITLR